MARTGRGSGSPSAGHITIQLDTVEPEALLYTSYQGYLPTPEGVWLRIADTMGPGGGWPIVELHGEPAAVRQYAIDNWGLDDDPALLEELFESWNEMEDKRVRTGDAARLIGFALFNLNKGKPSAVETLLRKAYIVLTGKDWGH